MACGINTQSYLPLKNVCTYGRQLIYLYMYVWCWHNRESSIDAYHSLRSLGDINNSARVVVHITEANNESVWVYNVRVRYTSPSAQLLQPYTFPFFSYTQILSSSRALFCSLSHSLMSVCLYCSHSTLNQRWSFVNICSLYTLQWHRKTFAPVYVYLLFIYLYPP